MTDHYHWNVEAVEMLKANYLHYSASMLADMLPMDALGNHPTRNAVIGKAARCGLTKPMRHATHAPRRRHRANGTHNGTVARWRPARPTLDNPTPMFEPHKTPATLAKFNEAIPAKQKLTFMQLTSDRCHWPIGDGEPPFMYCGAPTVETLSYCPVHCSFAYRQPEPRREAGWIPRSRT